MSVQPAKPTASIWFLYKQLPNIMMASPEEPPRSNIGVESVGSAGQAGFTYKALE